MGNQYLNETDEYTLISDKYITVLDDFINLSNTFINLSNIYINLKEKEERRNEIIENNFISDKEWINNNKNKLYEMGVNCIYYRKNKLDIYKFLFIVKSLDTWKEYEEIHELLLQGSLNYKLHIETDDNNISYKYVELH